MRELRPGSPERSSSGRHPRQHRGADGEERLTPSAATDGAGCLEVHRGRGRGPDLIQVAAYKASYGVLRTKILKLFNACLEFGCFPAVWKVGAVRTLLKGADRDEALAKSYRPICLLPVIGKSLERLKARRFDETFMMPQYAPRRQFGFRRGKSTVDAILEMRRCVEASVRKYVLAVLFDIAGAFDNVWWPSVMHYLRERDFPGNLYSLVSDYLSGKRVVLLGRNGGVEKAVTRGCPQGSILAPSRWNLVFDDLLTTLKREGHEAFAYADDLLLVFAGHTRLEIEERARAAVATIENWCSQEKLSLAGEKTEMILLKGSLPRRRPPAVRVNGKQIRMAECVRYLGVHFDAGMKINTHIRKVRDKGPQKINSLAALARATWGLRHRALRTLYTGLFLPIVTYAAPAWLDLVSKTGMRALQSAQRQALLRVTRAYRTIAMDALLIIAGAPPIDLHMRRLDLRYRASRGRSFEVNGHRFPEDFDGGRPDKDLNRER